MANNTAPALNAATVHKSVPSLKAESGAGAVPATTPRAAASVATLYDADADFEAVGEAAGEAAGAVTFGEAGDAKAVGEACEGGGGGVAACVGGGGGRLRATDVV